jgi:hypothetical protein
MLTTPRQMHRLLLPAAVAGVLALASCGEAAPTVPRIPAADQLDVAPQAGRPCDLLRPDRARGLGLVVPGVVENAPTGPACRSASTRPGHPSFIMGVDPNHGLDEVYQRRADHRLFQPGTVGGFPAVDTVDGPPSENEGCLVQVGVADNGLVIVAVGPADVTQVRPDPCREAHRVATTIIGQLKAGTP